MLYKKIHRQYLREFRMGRKFRYNGEVHEVAGKLYINYSEGYIGVSVEYNGPSNWNWSLIVINDNYYGFSIGEKLDKNNITFLD